MLGKLKVAPIILIAFGSVFLLNNLGILPWAIWTNIWKFWPVIIILIGLEALLGHAMSLKTMLILLLLVFLIPIVIAVNPITNNPLATDEIKISEELGTLTKAKIIIDMPALDLEIKAATDSTKLIDGKITFSKAADKPKFSKEETFGQAIFTISQDINSGLPFISSLRNDVDLFLSTQIALELQIKTGASNEKIDLSALRVDYLEIDSKASKLNLIFGDFYTSRVIIKTGASTLDIEIPEKMAARINIDSKVKNLSIADRFKQSGGEYKTANYDKAFTKLDIQIEAVAGSITIR